MIHALSNDTREITLTVSFKLKIAFSQTHLVTDKYFVHAGLTFKKIMKNQHLASHLPWKISENER